MRLAKFIAAAIVLLMTSVPAKSFEVAGRPIPGTQIQSACPGNPGKLVLNGAGLRRIWMLEIYTGALYLTERSRSAEAILGSTSPKRLVIHVLLSKISKEQLIENWRNGIESNHTAEELAALEGRLTLAFGTFFTDTFRGDEIAIDYAPCIGTLVRVNGKLRGTVPGLDFYQALLKVWIGPNPADASLKEALLGLQ